MKNAIKSVFNLKTILGCYIDAIGYGIGYYLPSKYDLHPVLCIVICLIVGTVFNFLGNKLLSTNYFNGSLQNKISVALFIYAGYLAAWMFTDRVLGYDLDNDFLSNLGIIIIIQIILIIIRAIKQYIAERKAS